MNIIDKCYKSAEKYNYDISIKFNTCFITTPLSRYYFELPEKEGNSITLWHENNRFDKKKALDYHRQWSWNLNIEQLFDWIYYHDEAHLNGTIKKSKKKKK